MGICMTTDLSDELWTELSVLEDGVNLISSGIVSAKELQDDLIQVLSKYAAEAHFR